MKKIIASIILCIASMLMLTACSSTTSSTTQPSGLKVEYDADMKKIDDEFSKYNEFATKVDKIYRDKTTPWCGNGNGRDKRDALEKEYTIFGDNKDQTALDYFWTGNADNYPKSFLNSTWKKFKIKWSEKSKEGNFSDLYNNDVKKIEQKVNDLSEAYQANNYWKVEEANNKCL